jgi:4-aminobutyrate aminotransferase-like enzyme
LKTVPESLSVCYLTCSGSEANELALRLARNFTKKKDIIVVDWAYHGNTTSLVEISPYKFKRKGGFPCPSYVHVVDSPDGFRGKYKYNDGDIGLKYAEDIKEKFKVHGDKIGTFICESILGCAGQVVLPPNYLKNVYRIVREHGGICIADEVQVGFGRVGDAFWGFQLQEVVPDIITLGKPIGNGHPIGAVITTQRIADTFANGMEYFNTFGGNNVSCVIGLEVLNVILEEKLQENARELGNLLKQGLQKLQQEFDCIGDIRGHGLFYGIEFISNPKLLTPATELANHIVQKLREDYYILVSTDGPYDNILKLKPPMCWTTQNILFFLTYLRNILQPNNPQTKSYL